MTPIVVMERVQARDAGGPRGGARGTLADVSVMLGAGLHAFLGAPEDGTFAIHDVLSGARAPQRGKVTVAGFDPARTSFLRARMGVLPPEPRLPAARTVRDAVRLAMRARGEAADHFDAVIELLGLRDLHARDPRALSFAEERAVELTLALSTPAPVLVLLHEPLADVSPARPGVVASRLRELAEAGACVIVTTSSPADARALADQVLVLHRGRLARASHAGEGLALPAPADLTVWLREGARALAAALSARPEVTSAAWEDPSATSAWPGAACVRLRGPDEAALALALADTVAAEGVDIEGIERRAPTLADVRVATEALWQMVRAQPLPPPAPVMPPPPPEVEPPARPAMEPPPPSPVIDAVDDAPALDAPAVAADPPAGEEGSP